MANSRHAFAEFARECFGNFFTRGKWANEVMPTEEIEAAIQCSLGSRADIDSPEISGNDIADKIQAEHLDWRIGLSVKPKGRTCEQVNATSHFTSTIRSSLMRKRLIWLCLGLIVGLLGPGYGPLAKSLFLEALAHAWPGSLEYCTPLGRHIAEMLNPDKPNEWKHENLVLEHRRCEVAVSPDGSLRVGKLANVHERLSRYDREVVARRTRLVIGALDEQANRALAKQLEIQDKLQVDEKLAAGLVPKH